MVKFITAASVLIGTIIGAGYLGIPYVISQSGFPLGLINLALVCSILMVTMLYLGEISLRTKQKHQLPGYAEKYLGKKGKILMFFALIVGIYSALLAYLIAEGDSLSVLLFGSTVYSLQISLAFWIVLSIMSYFGLKALEEADLVSISLITIMIISLVVLYWNKIDTNNLNYIVPKNFFVPFGVILFAFLGESAIPTVHDILGEDKKILKNIIVFAHMFPLIMYTIFTIIVLGSQGQNTPEIATITLGKPFIILGIITMFTSYLNLSIAVINTFRFDLKKSKSKSWFYASLIPLALFILLILTKSTSFVTVLSIGGLISGAMTAILILMMVKRAKKEGDRKPEYTIPYSKITFWAITLLFTAAVILEIYYLVI